MSDVIQGEVKKVEGTRIGVVVARFNRPVTEKLEQGAVQALKEAGYTDGEISVVRVPGAVEIPLIAKALLDQGYAGVVTLGVVIRGETTHYDYVCQSVERGVTELMLSYGAPVSFGVLTTENGEQALARAGGSKGNKGYEAAEVTLEMLNALKILKEK